MTSQQRTRGSFELTLSWSSAPCLLLLLLSVFSRVLAPHQSVHRHSSRSQLLHIRSVSPADYACQPIGPCQPCPPDTDELENQVCEIYHNRRLVYCIYSGNSSSDAASNQTQPNSVDALESDHQDGIGAGKGAAEFQTWEACERVVLKEQQDFYEFVLCNLSIAALSLLVYGFRTKQLVILQYRNLAARIGISPT